MQYGGFRFMITCPGLIRQDNGKTANCFFAGFSLARKEKMKGKTVIVWTQAGCLKKNK